VLRNPFQGGNKTQKERQGDSRTIPGVVRREGMLNGGLWEKEGGQVVRLLLLQGGTGYGIKGVPLLERKTQERKRREDRGREGSEKHDETKRRALKKKSPARRRNT